MGRILGASLPGCQAHPVMRFPHNRCLYFRMFYVIY